MRAWRLVSLFAAAWMLAAASPAWAGQKALGEATNAGFEEDDNGDGVPDGWSFNRQNKASQFALDDSVKREGRRSARISGGGVGNWLGQNVRVEPGAVYRASVWVRTEKLTTQPAWSLARHPNASQATLLVKHKGQPLDSGAPHAGTTDWTQEAIDFVAPDDGTLAITCLFANWAGPKGTVWFDGLELKQIAPPGAIGELPDPPQGRHALALWALVQKPPAWDKVLDAVEAHCERAISREAPWTADALTAVHAAAQEDPKLLARLSGVLARCTYEAPSDVMEPAPLRELMRAACGQAAKESTDAEAAARARLGLARLAAAECARREDWTVEAAVKALREAITPPMFDDERLAAMLAADANWLKSRDAVEPAVRLFDTIIAAYPMEHEFRSRLEMQRVRLLIAVGQAEKARQAAAELAAPDRKLPDDVRRNVLTTLARLNVQTGDLQKAKEWVHEAAERLEGDAAARARVRLQHAQALAAEKRWAECAAACQMLAAACPQALEPCFQAQKLAVQALAEQGLLDPALGAAKVLYGAAPNSEKEITQAVSLVMETLKAKAHSIALANQFVTFQSYGPAGADGKVGTEDDAANPLEDVRYVVSPEAEAQFAETLASLPEDFGGRRWRGYLCLYWGKPREALAEFVWRFDHAPLKEKAINTAIDDIVVALKACYGHTLAGERFMQYQKLGPAGPDGQKGTDDDLTDPTRDVLKPREAPARPPKAPGGG